MKFILLLSAISLFGIKFVQSRRCSPCENPQEICGEPPRCCESGYYIKDECECCKTCAKAENEDCGGLYGLRGKCSPETVCFESLDCKTTANKICVFPFKYKGKTYNQCVVQSTGDGSVNGNPWCATKVDRSGNLEKWGDCGEECPVVAYGSPLDFAVGKCISKRRALTLEKQIRSGSKTIKLDTPSSLRSGLWSEEAPRCSIMEASPNPPIDTRDYSKPIAPPPPPSAQDCTEIKGRRVCCSDYGECSGYTGPDPTPWKRAKFTSCEYSDGHLQCDFTDSCSKIRGRMVCCEDGGKCSGYDGPHPGSHLCFFSDGHEACA